MKNKYQNTIDTVIYGGTFNPIHKGHLEVIHYILTNFNIDKLILLPNKLSPFKKGEVSLSLRDRLKCINLALEDYKDMYSDDEVSKIEIDLFEINSTDEVTYTSNTIRHYIDDRKFKSPVHFIIGDDVLFSLSKWYDVDYIKKNVHFFVFRRENDGKKLFDIKLNLENQGFVFTFLDNSLFEYSSTAIREGDSSKLTKRVKAFLKPSISV